MKFNPFALFTKKAPALSVPQSTSGSGLTPMLYLERWGNMTNNLTPSRLKNILQAADDGDITEQHVLFADMEDRCEHLAAEIGKRKRALLTLDWEILPGRSGDSKAEHIAAAVREQFDMLPTTSDLLLDMADGIGHGFAALEIEWTHTNGLHVPAAFHHRPQSWFQVLQGNRNVVRLRDGSMDGAELWPFGWIVHTHRSKSGWLSRAGLFRTIAWAYLVRAYALESTIMYTQVHGMPFRLGKYPSGSNDEDKAALKSALANLGRDASGIMPQGMDILFETPANATQDIPGMLITRCEQGMSKAILGGTLTTQADGKSSTNALGTVHNEVRHDLLVSDAAQVAASITQQILAPLAYLNCGVADLALLPWFRFDTRQTEDIRILADALPKLAGVLDIPATWAHEKTKIPMAKDGEKLVRAPGQGVQTGAPAGGVAGMSEGALTVQAKDSELPVATTIPDTQAVIDAMSADTAIPDATDALLAPLLAEITQGLEPAELLVRLGDLYPRMDTAALTELMARAIMLATIVGEAAVAGEAASGTRDANA